MAYAEDEKGADVVADLLVKALDERVHLMISVVNWGEMYYIALREGGKERAELYRTTLMKYPIEIIDADQSLTLEAAHFKARHKISFADAFAAGLAKQKKAELVTGDREFAPLGNEIRICWL
jgi:predicted nucleic acid-binding protein